MRGCWEDCMNQDVYKPLLQGVRLHPPCEEYSLALVKRCPKTCLPFNSPPMWGTAHWGHTHNPSPAPHDSFCHLG